MSSPRAPRGFDVDHPRAVSRARPNRVRRPFVNRDSAQTQPVGGSSWKIRSSSTVSRNQPAWLLTSSQDSLVVSRRAGAEASARARVPTSPRRPPRSSRGIRHGRGSRPAAARTRRALPERRRCHRSARSSPDRCPLVRVHVGRRVPRRQLLHSPRRPRLRRWARCGSCVTRGPACTSRSRRWRRIR